VLIIMCSRLPSSRIGASMSSLGSASGLRSRFALETRTKTSASLGFGFDQS
jgi:hypothetical protein